MSTQALRLERSATIASALPVVAGLFLLMLRVEILGMGEARLGMLVVLYGLVAAVSLLPRTTAARIVLLPAWLVTAVGVAAVAIVAAAPWQTGLPAIGGTAAVLLGVGAAVAEEAFFRRLLFGWLLPAGSIVAVVGSALAFALVHVPLYGTSVLWLDFGAGLLLSWQRWASGRWAPSAVTHAFANVMAVVR